MKLLFDIVHIYSGSAFEHKYSNANQHIHLALDSAHYKDSENALLVCTEHIHRPYCFEIVTIPKMCIPCSQYLYKYLYKLTSTSIMQTPLALLGRNST